MKIAVNPSPSESIDGAGHTMGFDFQPDFYDPCIITGSVQSHGRIREQASSTSTGQLNAHLRGQSVSGFTIRTVSTGRTEFVQSVAGHQPQKYAQVFVTLGLERTAPSMIVGYAASCVSVWLCSWLLFFV